MYSLYFVQNIINLKILKEFYCESYLQSQKFHTNSGKLNLTLLLNLLTLFMTFGILISGAIPAPFDLAMSTNSSKVTKEYLLSKLGLRPLVMVIWVIKFPKIRYIHFLTTWHYKIQQRVRMLIFGQKLIEFCIPPLETWQPILPYLLSLVF